LSIKCGEAKKHFSIDQSKLEAQYKPQDVLVLGVLNTDNNEIDSIVYTLNDVVIGQKKDKTPINFALKNQKLGYQNIVGNQIINAWRGQNGTTAVSHLTAAEVYTNNLPCVNVWPTPNPPGDQYTFVYYRMRRIQDAGTGIRTQDIPFRFIPCMTAGLAYQLSNKMPGVTSERVMMLKADYEQQWQLAADEDRETAAIRIVPRNTFYYS
jgi:hypothetical protein